MPVMKTSLMLSSCLFFPSDCIINDNHKYLLEFLEGLAVPERSVQIQSWDTSGRVYLDYIHVIQTLQDIQQVTCCFRKVCSSTRIKI